MTEYQVLARKYRPQTFRDVIGQEVTITTLKNAIKYKKLANAYLFCGSRGTGKTTLARVLAKALNCQNPDENLEPCNVCSSCREITNGHSLDVLEIDGASHRGIEDIRQINDTVGYAAASGKYKIYIIDEVHMLTKEAFNALLKTLEEPPEKVKFFFATTEPHKVLPTILSRCQRFNLNRIPLEKIADKLRMIALDLGASIDEEAIRLLAVRADGGLRDAESLMDQILSFHDGHISVQSVADILGIMTKDALFDLDLAGKEGNLSKAFEIAERVFSEGKDLGHFVETLSEHYRNLLLIKMNGNGQQFVCCSDSERPNYEVSAKLYAQEQLLTILDFLLEAQSNIRFMPSPRFALETLLLKILRTHKRVPVDFLVRRLMELESLVGKNEGPSMLISEPQIPSVSESLAKPLVAPQDKIAPAQEVIKPPREIPSSTESTSIEKKIVDTMKAPENFIKKPIEIASAIPKFSEQDSISEDPIPSPRDLGVSLKAIVAKKEIVETAKAIAHPKTEETKGNVELKSDKKEKKIEPTVHVPAKKSQAEHDTLLQFAAVELEGTIQKRNFK